MHLKPTRKIEALGHTHVESDLPAIVRDWCVGDSVLCLVEGEFQYEGREAWKQLQPFTREHVLAGYRIFGGLVVIDSRPEGI